MAIVHVIRWETTTSDGDLVYFPSPTEAAEYVAPGHIPHRMECVELVCDNCGGADHRLFGTERDAHRVACDEGWALGNGSHYCPLCRCQTAHTTPARWFDTVDLLPADPDIDAQIEALHDHTITELTNTAHAALAQLLTWTNPGHLVALVAEVIDTD